MTSSLSQFPQVHNPAFSSILNDQNQGSTIAQTSAVKLQSLLKGIGDLLLKLNWYAPVGSVIFALNLSRYARTVTVCNKLESSLYSPVKSPPVQVQVIYR